MANRGVLVPATGPNAFVVPSNNRANTQGKPPIAGGNKAIVGRGSAQFNNLLPPGGFLEMPISGTQFYILAATGPVLIRASTGVYNQYTTGQGLEVDIANAFDKLTIQNPSSTNNLVYSIFVGWDNFIDKTLILNTVTTPNVIYPTYPTALSAATIDIPDRSASAFTDINGGQWYALQRVCISFFNVDTGITFLVQKAGALTGTGPAVGAVYPQTSLRLDASGHYSVNIGGANINAIVSEIYQAIQKLTP